jgi:hypothetical protein
MALIGCFSGTSSTFSSFFTRFAIISISFVNNPLKQQALQWRDETTRSTLLALLTPFREKLKDVSFLTLLDSGPPFSLVKEVDVVKVHVLLFSASTVV